MFNECPLNTQQQQLVFHIVVVAKKHAMVQGMARNPRDTCYPSREPKEDKEEDKAGGRG